MQAGRMAVVTNVGYMPYPSSILNTYAAAWGTTQSLAAQSGGVGAGAVLAAQAAGTLKGGSTPTLESHKQSDATHAALTKAVAQTCKAGGDLRACSSNAQKLGSYEAWLSSNDGPVTAAQLRKRDDSSIYADWLDATKNPTRVLPTKVTTPEVGSLAVTLAALSS